MKIGNSFLGLGISSKGMSIQRKRMDIISENIANADSVRNADGTPYKRKMLNVKTEQSSFASNLKLENQSIKLVKSNENHLSLQNQGEINLPEMKSDVIINEETDNNKGEVVYMPEHPDADDKGYVEMSNVNIINEMVDMIAASRSYEANLTALTSSKQMIKDSLEI
jgi:flagellar basal-body rod protein FlgC